MRLIDADPLKEKMCYEDYGCTEDGEEVTYRYVMEYDIDNAPTIDAEPVHRGRWIKYIPPIPEEDDGVEAWDCSECSAMVSYPTNYCPNCGAKMESKA